MNRSLFTPSFLALALLAVSAFTIGPIPATDEAAVRSVIAQMFEAFNEHDAEAITATYADGAQIFWGEGEVVTLNDRNAFIAQGRQWHEANAAMRIEAEPYTVRFLDNDTATAFITGRAFMGEQAVFTGHMFVVLQHTSSGWLIAAEHDAMLPASDG